MPRRVGLVVHGQPPELVGGTERLVADLARDLAARGDAVEVFSGSIEWRPQFQVAREASGPVPVVRVHRHDLFFERWDKLENPLVERAFLAWLDDFRPDLLHVHHWARLTTTLVRVARARGVPVLLSLHDLFASCPRYHRVKADLSFCELPPSPDACRHCAPRWRFQGDEEIDASVRVFADDLRGEVAAADVCLAPTEGHARRLLDWLGLQREVVALPPASTTQLAPATRPLGERPATPQEPLRVGTFGHLHELKGVEVLLDAQAALPDPRTVELHVWGAAPTPEQEARLRARAGDRRVVWHGRYAPVDLAAALLDAAVVPTLCAESYSFALDEACALGIPVLATDLGALRDRATPRVALFPRGDARALAAALQRLATDPAERRRQATAPAPPRLDAATHLSRLLALYAGLQGRPRAPSDPAVARAAADSLARRERAFLLREAGLKELLRSEGWEDVVARLQAENEALKRRT
ncbi:MAG TPA: glycosyltransferase [Planctomycetota bacterium]|nr:glycosyltransferase [Planctomycetota bacterium]